MTRVWNLAKLLIRVFTLLLVLAACGGTAVGNWNPLRVAEATEGEPDHEATETRRESSRTKRCLERWHSEIDEHRSQPVFSRHGRPWIVEEPFALSESLGPPLPPRAPPALA